MKNVRILRVLVSLVVLTLVAGLCAAALAEEVTLIGQLTASDAGGYLLVEAESGESVTVTGPEELAEHIGQKVKVTGEWVENEDGMRYFAAKKVEPVE
jgi:hypothetical protein